MLNKTTKLQHQHIQSVLSGLSHPEILSTIESRHQFALQWHWEGGLEPVKWIATQPDTDKGTALLIYWLCSPRFVKQYKSIKDVPEDMKEIYKLTSTIEKNIKNNFYTSEEIAFDPASDNKNNYTNEYRGLFQAKKIPPEMLKKTRGTKITSAEKIAK